MEMALELMMNNALLVPFLLYSQVSTRRIRDNYRTTPYNIASAGVSAPPLYVTPRSLVARRD